MVLSLAAGQDALSQAVELPAGFADLDTSLAAVGGEALRRADGGEEA